MRASCGVCRAPHLHAILSLGDQPLANALVRQEDLARTDDTYPLDLLFCETCSLVQLSSTPPPSELFDEYAYFSSQSQTMIDSAGDLAAELMSRGQSEEGYVLEIASNDGYLLAHYMKRGVRVLGIDPAANVVEVARQRGIPTICDYFTESAADSLVAEHGEAQVVHANNVLAHVPDPVDLLRGIRTMLAQDGIAVIEFPSVKNLVEGVAFDTIYHEHIFYYSFTSFHEAVRRAGLHCVEVQELGLHGGSLRVFVARDDANQNATVPQLLKAERAWGMNSLEFYSALQGEVESSIASLEQELEGIIRTGGTVAGYGAAAKATVLLNAAPRAAKCISFIVDSTPYKQGRYVPGVRIPIHPPEHLLDEMPSHTLIFAWNFVDEIVAKESVYVQRGGRFLTPLPSARYVSSGFDG